MTFSLWTAQVLIKIVICFPTPALLYAMLHSGAITASIITQQINIYSVTRFNWNQTIIFMSASLFSLVMRFILYD